MEIKQKGKYIECHECKKVFYRCKSQIRYTRNFCSVLCKSITDKNDPNFGSWNKGIVRTEEQRSLMSFIKQGQKPYNTGTSGVHLVGSKNPMWKGGTSRIYKNGYNSIEYRKWRKDVFARDNYTCQECGFNGSQGFITAHHIKSFAYFPKLRFEISNGKTLCEPCHEKTDNYKGRANVNKAT